ncbi:hypothetical protein AAFP30_05375 [Gordonia sp. CPCC 205515]|uniref:hypothetical protein n=1 Tax=Gordonia sp. CPCC 205515 TaxID=3140791 RepID=UPI003AF3F06C
MSSNRVSLNDQLVAMSTASGRPAVDRDQLRSLLATGTPELARYAYLRHTASNRPAPAPPRRHPAGSFWGWCLRHRPIAIIIALFLWAYLGGITGSVTIGGLLVATMVGAIIVVQTWPRRRRTPPADTNPWPFGADRVPGYGHLAGESRLLRPEAELLGIAVLLVEGIRVSPIAKNNVIIVGNLLHQVEQSLQGIGHECYRIWQIRSSLEAPETHTDVGAALQAALDQRIGMVQRNWRELLDNVAQLAELAVNVDAYTKLLRDHERHQRLIAESPGYPMPAMPHPQWQQLQEMQVNLAAQVGFINDTARRVSNVDFR